MNRRQRSVRGVGIVGLSAVSAVFAHGGPGALADPLLLLASTAGAALAAAFLAASATRVLRIRREIVRVDRGGDARLAYGDGLPLGTLVAVMVVCQAAAHLTLLAAGVHSSGLDSPALHLVLAIAGATLIWKLERWVAGTAGKLTRRLAALAQRPPRPQPLQASRRVLGRGRAAAAPGLGRGPPLLAR